MGDQGRESRLLALAERGVTALEKLAEEPNINLEVGLPICPHCEKINPDIYSREGEESGPLLEFVIYVQCQNCKEFFYAVPVEWHMYKARSGVEEEMHNRRENFSGNSRQNH